MEWTSFHSRVTLALGIGWLLDSFEVNVIGNVLGILKKLWQVTDGHASALGNGRTQGLMIGVELVPEAGGARRLCEKFMTKGLLCKETHENTIRFAPPLVIKKEEIDWALERIEPVLAKV